MISIKYNRIESYYAKSTMREKNRWNRMSFYKMQELGETFDFDKIRLQMLWNFHDFTLKFVNGEWWQHKQTNLQSNINRTFVILSGLFQKQTNKLNSLKIDYKCKNHNWTLTQKSNEIEN